MSNLDKEAHMVVRKPALRERGPSRASRNVATESDRLLAEICCERRALMRADAVLRCFAAALEYNSWTADEPDYADAIAVASQLISQSIERLESRAAMPVGSAHCEPESAT